MTNPHAHACDSPLFTASARSSEEHVLSDVPRCFDKRSALLVERFEGNALSV